MPPVSPTPFRRGVTWFSTAFLLLLLIAPVLALIRLEPWVDWRILVGAPTAVSLFAFFSYRSDKRRAEAGAWRIPETSLHLTALLGGWPGAFLAQRMFRHKVSKVSFQVTFWAVVLLHEFVAIDSLLHWQISTDVYRIIQAQIGQR
jgi:uncharacterized membrane protein YsdA (DUF1294 family)